MTKKYRRICLAFAGLIIIAAIAFSWMAGSKLIAPANVTVALPPGLEVEQVDQVYGWLMEADDAKGILLLLHGNRSNRLQMVERAKAFNSLGYTALMIDLQAHGENPGDAITFGLRESESVQSALAYLKRRYPNKPIIALGVSLGGASCLLGKDPISVDALIVESVYPSIDEAVSNRLAIYLGAPGRLGKPLLTMQIPLRLGVSTSDLRPIDRISQVNVPILVIGGAEDERTTKTETTRLYDAAKEPKELWIVEGARHVNLFEFNREAYLSTIGAFLEKH